MKVYSEISPALAKWIEAQPVIFIATAPLAASGHINLSPRGLDALRIINSHELAILDLTGSGNETAAHLAENGRITVMLCAFEGEPRIIRLYGQGVVILPEQPEWSQLRSLFAGDTPGVRQIFHIHVSRVQSSCGFGVPLMDFVSRREDLLNWASKKGADGVHAYQRKNNAQSIDRLPAPTVPRIIPE